MKRLLILLAVIPFIAAGQQVEAQAPDNDAILRSIVDSGSPYYYPSLMIRYEKGDTTLTLDDYHHLYYGYAYQDDYKPLEPIPAESRLLMVLERSPEPDSLEAAELYKYAREVMKADPFSPKNLNFMAYACDRMGDVEGAKTSLDRLHKVLATIEASGSGLRENSPWHVLWFSHATDVVATLGEQIGFRQLRTRSVEYISLVGSKMGKQVKGYFFDFGRMYWRKPDNLPKREKRVGGFELNGIKLGRNKGLTTPGR